MKKCIFGLLLLTLCHAQASEIVTIDNQTLCIVYIQSAQKESNTTIKIPPHKKIFLDHPIKIPCNELFNDIEAECPDYLEIFLYSNSKAKQPSNRSQDFFLLSFLITEGKVKSYSFNGKALYSIWLQKRMIYNFDDDTIIQHIGTSCETPSSNTYTIIIDETHSLHLIPHHQ